MGNPGQDKLFGGADNDVLISGTGHNTLDGEEGTDMVLLVGAADDDERAYQGLTTQMRHKTTVATPATTTHPSFAPLAPHIELLGVANVSAVQFDSDWAG